VLREFIRDRELEKMLAGRRMDAGGQMRPDMRRKKERRSNTDRRSGVDRRTFGKIIPGVDMEKGIARFGYSQETFYNVLRSYALNTRPLLDRLKYPRQETLAEYAVTVHGIKGSSYGIYAVKIGAKAEALEKAAREGDLKFINAGNPAFLAETLELVNFIYDALGKMTAQTREDRGKPDREILLKLAEACNQYDIDEIDAAMEEMELYDYSSDEGLTKWLRDNVDQMNYRQIVERLSALI